MGGRWVPCCLLHFSGWLMCVFTSSTLSRVRTLTNHLLTSAPSQFTPLLACKLQQMNSKKGELENWSFYCNLVTKRTHLPSLLSVMFTSTWAGGNVNNSTALHSCYSSLPWGREQFITTLGEIGWVLTVFDLYYFKQITHLLHFSLLRSANTAAPFAKGS